MMETAMSYLLFGLVQVLVIAAIAAMIWFLVSVILSEPNVIERLLRIAAFGAGLLTYVGAKALGVSIPELMSSALIVANPLSLGFLGVIFPALVGTLVAWFCLRLMRKDTDRTARGLLLFSAFFFTMFADTYANMATQTTSTSVDLVLPNITFVLGVVLYVIFMFERGATEQQYRGQSLSGVRQSLKDSLQAFRERLGFGARGLDEEAPTSMRDPASNDPEEK